MLRPPNIINPLFPPLEITVPELFVWTSFTKIYLTLIALAVKVVSKNIKQLNDILIMIGLENKMMKMKVVQEERTIKTKFFFNLNSLFNHIIFTEKSLEGVLYIK